MAGFPQWSLTGQMIVLTPVPDSDVNAQVSPEPQIPARDFPDWQPSHGSWVSTALDRYGGDLARYAQRFVHDPSAAQDVVQETFLRLCQQQQSELNGRLVPWLFAVCRNVALDARRKEQKMSSLVDDEISTSVKPQASQSDQIEMAETVRQVAEMLSQLPDNQQEVIRLKFQQGLSYKEISSVTGHSVSNVGFLIHTGLKKLREWTRRDEA